MSETLLTLVCPPSLEQTINDWILEQDDIPGFTSMHVYGHGSDPKILSLSEQVEGRKKQVMFQIHMKAERANKAINDLKQDFPDTRIHYWLVPVLETGSLHKK